jgi:hypothetical protein
MGGRRVTESRLPLRAMPDDALGAALQELGRAVAFPSAAVSGAPDIAMRVRVRIVETGAGRAAAVRGRRAFGWRPARPMRRSLIFALAALLILAAIAGAVGFGLPGLRIIFGPLPTPSLSPSPSLSVSPSPTPLVPPPVGASLSLGAPLPLDEIEGLVDFDLILPPDPAIGPPDASFLADERVALVWATKPGLPETNASGIGLVLNEFPGTTDRGFYQKVLTQQTTVTPVTVNGLEGYWLTGAPHFFMWVDRDGAQRFDEGRVVGDTLIWTSGETTYRLESALGKDAAIRLAESLR